MPISRKPSAILASVAHQSAGFGNLTVSGYQGNQVACCQGGKLRASDGEQGTGSDEKCVRPFALEWREGAPISRPFLALRTWICMPMARAADSACSNVVLAVVVLVGSTSTATRVAAGTNSRRSCNRFVTCSTEKILIPVKFPPGRARLSTRPSLAGSSAATKRIGIVAVAALAANAAGTVAVAITATRRRAKSSASAGNLSISFSAERYKTDTFSPSTKPACLRPCRNPRSCSSSIDRGARNPIAGCCARAVNALTPPHVFAPGRRLNPTTLPVRVCITANSGGSCPLWVKSGHWSTFEQCLLYPQKRTLELNRVMSALCQKRTNGTKAK